MYRPTKVIVSLTIIFVGLFVFYFTRIFKPGSQAVNYAGQIEDFKNKGVPAFHLPQFNFEKGVLEGSLGLDEVHTSVVLINFWASWCEPCKTEFSSLVELSERFAKGNKLTILAVSLDKDLGALVAFLSQNKKPSSKNFVVLVDRDFLVPQRYGTKKVPETFIVGRDHKLIMKVIDEQNWLSPEFLSFLTRAMEQP